jgi:TPP-dependent 2-oxoacid decarboxylase
MHLLPHTDTDANSAADLTAGMGFAAATIVDATSTAVSQIDGILNTMFYERKAVYIGIVPSVAGVVIAVSPGDTAGSSGSTGYSVSAGQVHAASAGESMCALYWWNVGADGS